MIAGEYNLTLQLMTQAAHHLRPALLLEALQHLQFAGFVTSTANQPQDDLTKRRYWRVKTFWDKKQ